MRKDERSYDIDRTGVTVIPGTPPVFLSGNRLGRLVGSDTQWAALPDPSDSLKRAAWTWNGRYRDYELDNFLDCCVRNGDLVYGGVDFSGGGGMNGVGGLVVYSARSGALEVHRWPELLRWPSGPIAATRDSLWLVLSAQGEFISSSGGLLVADLRTGRRRVLWTPDVVIEHHAHRTGILLGTGHSLGVAKGAAIRWWTPVPTPGGGWRMLELVEPPEG
jgi:hypothetical protein